MLKPEGVEASSSSPNLRIFAGSRPISSLVSRNAAAQASSPISRPPPGKAIWLRWVGSVSVRLVRIVHSSPAST